jgi:chromosome segregation ATPase
MSSILSSIYSFISSYSPIGGQQPYQSDVASLSTRDRDTLVNEIANEVNQVEGSLAELEITLAECNSSLEQFDKKERFLGVRINSYRKLLRQRDELMATLQSTTNTNNNEMDELESKQRDQLNILQTKHAADEKSLQSVVELHKEIISEIESLRRRIATLKQKKDDILRSREQCNDFLMAAEEYNHVVSLEDIEGST